MSKWVYDFGFGNADGNASMRDILGGKGANLAEMNKLEISVPPGFTISTKVCDYYYEHKKTYPEELKGQVDNAIKEIDKDTQFKIFGNKEDNIYFNTEVMNPGIPDGEEGDPRSAGTQNVIPYDKKTLLIHEVGHSMFDPNTALAYDDPESIKRVDNCYSILENALIGKSTDDPAAFSIETHPRRKLDPAGMTRAADVLAPTIEAIDNVVSDFGLNDSSTIQDLVMVQVKPIIDGFGMTEDRNKAFILRLMKLCRSLEDPNKLMPCGTKDPRTGVSFSPALMVTV